MILITYTIHEGSYIKPASMGESIQGYSWIQDFEADFP